MGRQRWNHQQQLCRDQVSAHGGLMLRQLLHASQARLQGQLSQGGQVAVRPEAQCQGRLAMVQAGVGGPPTQQ